MPGLRLSEVIPGPALGSSIGSGLPEGLGAAPLSLGTLVSLSKLKC